MVNPSLSFAVVIGLLAGATSSNALAESLLRLTGIAFVDSSVTGQGSKARLPEGTKIYPLGTKITGTVGCPTTPYRTDGLIVAVIDYEGRPAAASIALTRSSTVAGQSARAPYYLNLDAGRTLQYLGPVFDNAIYNLKLTSNVLTQTKIDEVTGSFELARACSALR